MSHGNPTIAFSIADLPINVPLGAAFQIAKESQVDGIEILPGFKTYPGTKVLADLSDHYQVCILSIHYPLYFVSLLCPGETPFQIARYFNAQMVIHPLKSEPITSRKHQEYFSAMSRMQEKYSVPVSLENTTLVNTIKAYRLIAKSFHESTTNLLPLMEVCKQYNLGMTLDTSHVAIANMHELEDFQTVFPYIKNFHLSDFDEQHQHLALGKGKMEVRQFLHQLKKDKYNGQITLELTPHIYREFRSYRQGLFDSVRILKEVFES